MTIVYPFYTAAAGETSGCRRYIYIIYICTLLNL